MEHEHQEHHNHPPRDHEEHDAGHENHGISHTALTPETEYLRRFIIVTVLLVPLLLLTPFVLQIFGLTEIAYGRYVRFLISLITFYYSLIFFQHARHEIRFKNYGMMTLVSVALAAGFIFSVVSTFSAVFGGMEFYIEMSTLVWVLLFGHYLEARSMKAAGSALSEVAKLLPKFAHKVDGDVVTDIDIASLKQGDLVLVKPGEKFPADGEIIEGSASVDEALISGESRPVTREPGDPVAAGSICLDGSLKVRLSRVGENSTIGQIGKLIAEAQKSKPSAQRLADRAAKYLTFIALSTALATVLVWTAVLGQPLTFSLTLAITVLVISCPHALGLAIPAVSTIATQLSVRNGIFIKDMGKLEAVRGLDYVVFDKTGTLTEGRMVVTDIIPLISSPQTPHPNPLLKEEREIKEGRREGTGRVHLSQDGEASFYFPSPFQGEGQGEGYDILQIAASLESLSEHPLARAVVNKAKDEKVDLFPVVDFKAISGQGIEGKIDGKKYYLGNRRFINSVIPTPFGELRVNSAEGSDEAKDLSTRSLLEMTDKITGLQSQGKTVLILADEKEVLGLIALSDQIRPESYQAVRQLHQMGIKVAMLTGDNQAVANNVAKELGIDDVYAEVLPEEKYQIVQALQNPNIEYRISKQIRNSNDQNSEKFRISAMPAGRQDLGFRNSTTRRVVAMVGDGINDAPALAQADVGVAIGAGTDVAVGAGDIVLTRSNPEDMVRLIILSKKVYRKMIENLIWALGYNIVAIPAAAGVFAPFFLRPEWGAIAMSLSAVIVTANAILLRRVKLEAPSI